MDKLKLVKASVFVLTFLLVLGTLLLLTVLYRRTRGTPSTPPATLSLLQPAGSRIESFNNSDGKIYVLVKDGGQADRIVVLSASDHRIQYTINLY